MKRTLSFASLGLVVFGGFIASHAAVAASRDSIERQLNDLEARVAQIERVVNNQSLINLANQLTQLQAATRELRGDVQELQHSNQNAAKRQRQLYLDVDRRLQALEQAEQVNGAGAPLGPSVPGAGTAVASGSGAGDAILPGADVAGGGELEPTADSQTTGAPGAGGQSAAQSYGAAFDLIQAHQYADAATAFKQFIQMYPTSSLTDNAQYWLAETHYVQGDYAGALAAFQKVVAEYPQSSKVPAALLKVGYCNDELKMWDAARTALRTVRNKYPNTTAARLAQQRLDRIAGETG